MRRYGRHGKGETLNRRIAHPGSSASARTVVAAMTTGALLAGVFAVAPAMAEPDQPNVVAVLVDRIAQVDQKISDLRGAVATKRQSVNRAIVDVQNAENAKQAAAGAVTVADGGVTDADQKVTTAQAEFDKMVRAAYVQGNNAGALVNTLGGNDPAQVLQRQATLDFVTKNQRDVLVRLRGAKAKALVSRDSARATKAQADAAAQAAADRKRSAEDSITETVVALQQQQQQQQQLVISRGTAEKALADAKAAAGDKPAQRRIYQAYVVAEQQRVSAPAAPAAKPAAPGAPAGPVVADPVAGVPAPAGNSAQTMSAANGFATGLVSSATSLFGFSAPIPQQAPAGVPVGPQAVTNAGAVGSASGLTGAQAIDAVINRAASVIGVQYSWGGGTAYGATRGVRDGGVADSYGDYNKLGFDCSGLMAYSFAAVGIALPKYSGYQYNIGMKVPVSQIKRGDMVFRGAGGSEHVALYIGNGQIIESPESGAAVHVAPFDSSTFLPQAVRVINS
jgi:cell wall-associated NlpC family hydrolase